MASRRSRPTRRACWRKSGVVSMTMFCSARERSSEGRRRLSWGSLEVQTRQWQPREGTPMEVPEPRTVSFIGAAGIDESIVAGEEGEEKLTQRAQRKRTDMSDVKRAQGLRLFVCDRSGCLA